MFYYYVSSNNGRNRLYKFGSNDGRGREFYSLDISAERKKWQWVPYQIKTSRNQELFYEYDLNLDGSADTILLREPGIGLNTNDLVLEVSSGSKTIKEVLKFARADSSMQLELEQLPIKSKTSSKTAAQVKTETHKLSEPKQYALASKQQETLLWQKRLSKFQPVRNFFSWLGCSPNNP